MEIIPLSEGTFTVDRTKEFLPFDKEKDILTDRPRGSLLVEVQPFAVRMDDEVILFDTGLGFSQDGEMQLHRNLKDHGILPEDITRVLLSHLHKDHSGGILDKNNSKPAFANATYYVGGREFQNAMESNTASYRRSDFETLSDSSQLSLLSEGGTITNNIHYELSGGHSPYHIVFWLKENGEIIFFGGDEAPQHQQMKNRFMAKYDHDGRKAMELRSRWWAQGKDEGWTFLFYHDIRNPFVKPLK